MTKQEYLEQKENLKKKIKDLNEAIENLSDNYIESNRPCKVGDVVEITHNSGRVQVVEVKAFGIFRGDVYINSFYPEKNNGEFSKTTSYANAGHGKVKVIKI